jgi:hypothetical protein
MRDGYSAQEAIAVDISVDITIDIYVILFGYLYSYLWYRFQRCRAGLGLRPAHVPAIKSAPGQPLS